MGSAGGLSRREAGPWEAAAAPAGSDLYYGTVLCAPPVRDAIRALHAFAYEIRNIPRTIADPGVARLKLAWWREEIGRMERGNPTHPITATLASTFPEPRNGLAGRIFQEMINGREWELNRPVFATYAHLIAACRRLDGALWRLCASASGARLPSTLEAAETLGCALGLHSILHDLGADLRLGLNRLPVDELQRLGVGADELPSLPAAQLEAIATHAAGQIRQLVLEGLVALPQEERLSQLALLIATELMVRQLAEEQTDGFRLLERRVMLTPLRKLWTAIRIRRRERRLARRLAARRPS